MATPHTERAGSTMRRGRGRAQGPGSDEQPKGLEDLGEDAIGEAV
jgi:hypothetical protein